MLFFFPLQPNKAPKLLATSSLEKPVKLGISPSFLPKNLIWNPEILPPFLEIRICSVLPSSPPAAPALWGRIALNFRSVSFSPALPPASSPC
ncbi:hypothetical protein SLEP1_g22848 [Rubroshorea leprosula]|uniref:Uncharacterized protein n=1 Tax=Rubroshorea leprosula TaxID=152421 RepID=A0AAV5JAF9_9ROSI|nr:hypothetical protein SLEP1_g22848 [Rubroshorea leprosula]